MQYAINRNVKCGRIRQLGSFLVPRDDVRDALKAGFSFSAMQSTFRSAQRGAFAAIHAHWTVSEEPALVVMPTGSGKTETMLVLLAGGQPTRLLVIVPWVKLREQTEKKFLSLGLLKQLKIVPDSVPTPVVAVLQHRFSSAAEVEELVGECNVVVAGIQVLSSSKPEALNKLALMVSHVFIDEAHHLPAASWSAVHAQLKDLPTVLFTATPFRRDGQKIAAKVVYNFPLRLAQQEGFFRQIQLVPVFQFSQRKADEAIAEAALNCLRQDLAKNFDHLLMVRASVVDRAQDLLKLYHRLAPGLKPVIFNSRQKAREQQINFKAVEERTSRILVCVDMLGEGFDLPQLKVAALHDVHRSLAVTLQFIGRFTRTEDGLGDASVVVNLGDVQVEDALQNLFAEDADWNSLITILADKASGRVQRVSEMIDSFTAPPQISLRNIFPKMSTTVFKTTCSEWQPAKLKTAWPAAELFWGPCISRENSMALLVVRQENPVPWGDIKELSNVSWHLYAFYWESERSLLFIHSSDKDSVHDDLAKLVCGEDTEIIKGEPVYRCLHGISRLLTTNLGLLNAKGGPVSHEMMTGPDVAETLTTTKLNNRLKTNIFGRGYGSEGRTSRGCSSKGRVWSHEAAADVGEWRDWCQQIGLKLTDDSIDPELILKGVLLTKKCTERPELVPLAIDWPLNLLRSSEEAVIVNVGGRKAPFYDFELKLTGHDGGGPIAFSLCTDPAVNAKFQVEFGASGPVVKKVSEPPVSLEFRRRTSSLEDYFRKHLPTLYFEEEVVLESGLLCNPRTEDAKPYDRSKILQWDWAGVDLKRESQGKSKEPRSIQRRVLEKIEQDWEFVFDDDSSGEIADVVALKREGENLHVRLVHCKYAQTGQLGTRVQDLYEVCGQAQKSIRWRERWSNFFPRLIKREGDREKKGEASRIERGDKALLRELQMQSRLLKVRMEIWIVQPGLSKAQATDSQLHLLASTENYLSDTWRASLTVVGSA